MVTIEALVEALTLQPTGADRFRAGNVPAELDVWTRFVGAPSDATMSQALLAFASDGFLIGTAMRPHPGVGQPKRIARCPPV